MINSTYCIVGFFKQKTAYVVRISDWSSDVCSSDLKYSCLGFPINFPFGIPAGPVLNSKFIKAAFEFGFSVPVYKTVRADFFPCQPYPNVMYVNTPKAEIGRASCRARVCQYG